MKRYFAILFLTLALTASAQETPEVFEAFSETAFPAAPVVAPVGQQSTDKLPLEKHDTTAIVPAPASGSEAAAEKEAAPAKKKKKQEFKLVGDAKELEEEDEIPTGTLAVYIDIEAAFNKNPWTLQARRNIRLDLETKQLEYAQMQSQLIELKAKEKNLEEEMNYYKSFYQTPEFIEPKGTNTFPKLQRDDLNDVLSTLVFSASDMRIASPENTPQKIEQIKEAIKDTKKAIYEKENYLLNYKALSKEEVLSRQDYIVQEILKEIYSGIKEYAKVREIGIIVDKKDLIYGKPLNVTDQFIKWMKSYHKKYVKENGDIL